MSAWKRYSNMVIVFIACVVGLLVMPTVSVHAAPADAGKTLVGDLHLPAAVVQVLVANSTASSGAAITTAPDAVTVGDVATWQTVSLAQRTVNNDGSVTSTPSAAVASWLASLAQTPSPQHPDAVESADVLLWQDMAENANGTYSPAAILGGSIPTGYGRSQVYTSANMPVFNTLMAVLMSAQNAQVIDLTGIVGQVQPAANRVKMLAMLQTPELPNLQELDLGHNMLGDQTDSNWGYYRFRMTTLHSASVRSWDLSYEDFSYLDANMLANLGAQTRNINLASNVLKTINYNNGGYLGVTGADGSVDLSNNDNLSSVDSDTFYVLAHVIGIGGDTILPDAIANAVITKALTTWPNINNLGVNAVADQLMAATLAELANTQNAATLLATLQVDQLQAAAVQGLSDADFAKLCQVVPADQVSRLQAKRQKTTPNTAKLLANGNWLFGAYHIGETTTSISIPQQVVTISGTLPPGQRLSVTMSPWTAAAAQLAPVLGLPAGANGWQETNLEVDSAAVVLTNPNPTAMDFDQTLAGVTLKIPDAQLSQLQPDTTYTGTFTWTFEDVPTSDTGH
ncbi:hypothetical protein ACFQ5J_02360 [Lacticaseibacillus baoqingensis]|uniref:WxL domain-containing protein n=1 Tax=Lacticaseibacillus baoqingensis TaxID=2486013 RepID=A0ABW4E5L8_9LACO|nr:hypothetical protein [Lacticaseibacillus baoqingensis]